MKLIWAYIKIGFKNNTIYRANYLLGLVGAFIQLFITLAIWKALYGGDNVVNDISFKMLATNFVLAIGLQNAFAFNDFGVQGKYNDGSIAMEFIKPVDYRLSLLATDMGNIAFKVLTNFVPVLITSIFVVGIQAPHSICEFLLFLISIILGFLILWAISFIVNMTTFWIINVWSVSVLKGILISVFSGITLPIWFLPDSVLKIIKYTPFESIYFSPIQMYLGQLASNEIMNVFIKQLFWFAVLATIGNIMWMRGRKRLIVQGG